MILGTISFILSCLGIYGYFSENFILLYIGLGAVIVEHFIGIYSGEQKGLSTVWLAIICAVGMIIGGFNPLNAIALCLCFEGSICYVLGIILIIVFAFLKKKSSK